MTDKPESEVPEHARPADEEWASLARSLAAEQKPGAAPATKTDEPRCAVQRTALMSTVALLLAFVAVMVAGMLWWQYRQFYVSLDQTDAAAAEALTRVRAEQRALQDQVAEAGDDISALRSSTTTLGERLDALPGRFADLEQRLDAVQAFVDARGELRVPRPSTTSPSRTASSR
jgi:septal ring factor EnvC (AmiA/AmiB activator)